MTLKAKIHNRFAFCVNFLRPCTGKKSARKRLVSGRSADSGWLHGCGGCAFCILQNAGLLIKHPAVRCGWRP